MNLCNLNVAKSGKKERNNEQPAFDDFVYCDKCDDFVYAYCSIHGPLLVIPDDKVSSKPKYPSFVPRAALTVPSVFLHLAPSRIPGAGVGVFSTLTLPRGVRFGPYRGRRTNEIRSMYCWQLYDGNNKPSHVVDAADANNSNWMRYVNCARHWCEQNLVAYQYRGQLYYRTIKNIPPFTELMVFYGAEYANYLKIDLRRYNSHQQDELRDTPLINNIEDEIMDIEDFSSEYDISNIVADESSSNYDVARNNNKIITARYNKNKNSFNHGKENRNITECNTKIIEVNENKECGYDFNSNRFTFNKYYSINKHNENKNISNEDTEENQNISQHAQSETLSLFEQNTDTKGKSVDISRAEDKTWQCPHCNRILSRKTTRKRHYSTHFVKYSCHLCPYQTKIETEFRKHEIRHAQIKQFVCDICYFIANSRSNLGRHKKCLHNWLSRV